MAVEFPLRLLRYRGMARRPKGQLEALSALRAANAKHVVRLIDGFSLWYEASGARALRQCTVLVEEWCGVYPATFAMNTLGRAQHVMFLGALLGLRELNRAGYMHRDVKVRD